MNFDAKVRRESFEPLDLFYAHIGGMDAFARGLKIAAAMRTDKALESGLDERYASWDSDLGQKIENGTIGFSELEAMMLDHGEVVSNRSGRQELLENIVNRYIDNV